MMMTSLPKMTASGGQMTTLSRLRPGGLVFLQKLRAISGPEAGLSATPAVSPCSNQKPSGRGSGPGPELPCPVLTTPGCYPPCASLLFAFDRGQPYSGLRERDGRDQRAAIAAAQGHWSFTARRRSKGVDRRGFFFASARPCLMTRAMGADRSSCTTSGVWLGLPLRWFASHDPGT
jgi:hypothetical protein